MDTVRNCRHVGPQPGVDHILIVHVPGDSPPESPSAMPKALGNSEYRCDMRLSAGSTCRRSTPVTEYCHPTRPSWYGLFGDGVWLPAVTDAAGRVAPSSCSDGRPGRGGRWRGNRARTRRQPSASRYAGVPAGPRIAPGRRSRTALFSRQSEISFGAFASGAPGSSAGWRCCRRSVRRARRRSCCGSCPRTQPGSPGFGTPSSAARLR